MDRRALSTWAAYALRSLAEAVADWRGAVQRLAFQPLIYLLVFGGVLGNTSAVAAQPLVVAPGIIAIVVMNAAMAVVGGMFVTGYYFHAMEAWLAGPVSRRGLALALAAGGTAMACLAGLCAMAIIRLVLGLAPQRPFLALAATAFGGAAFALLFLIAFALPRTPNRAQGILAFLMMPMMFFGCTFYTWDSLARPWNLLALLMPTTYLAEALRAAYQGDGGLAGWPALLGGAAILAVLGWSAERVFTWRFRDYPW